MTPNKECNTLIRQAERSDIQDIGHCMMNYHGNNHFGIRFSSEYTLGLLELLIDGSVVLVAEIDTKIEGVFVALVTPCIANARVLQATVLCFWVNRTLSSEAIRAVGEQLLREGKAQLSHFGAEIMLISTNEQLIPELGSVCRELELAPIGMVWRGGIESDKHRMAS